jgi:very-short-patch-repair endonuclease
MSSQLARDVFKALKRLFPLNVIQKEHYVYYKNTRLFFDFYIKDLGILVEVQGRQHTDYVHHFHGDKESFRKQKVRDNLKVQYIQENEGLSLVRFYHDEKLTDKKIYNKILKSINRGFYE